MKIKNITIAIKSAEQGLKEFATTLKNVQAGHAPKRQKESAYFVSVEAFQSVLTPKRLALLQTVHRQKPQSIYELAHLVNRNLKNVQDDISLLARLGFVSLTKKREIRNKVTPRADYDRIQIQIPI